MVVAFNALNVRPGVVDGAATYAVNVLARLPAALPEARVVAFVRRGEERIPAAPNLVLHRVAVTSTAARVAREAVALTRELRAFGADVLVAPYESIPLAPPCPVLVVAQNLVYHRRGFDDYLGSTPGERLVTRAQAAYYRRRMRSAYARAAAVVAVSEATARTLAREAGLDRAKTTVVHEGADSILMPAPGPERAREPRLLVVGALAPYKNVDVAVEAFEGVAAELPDLRLAVVGGGWRGYDRVVARRASSSPFRERIDLPGPAAPRDLAALYESSLALLHLSDCESFGLPVAEAMRYGLPVVASDRSSLPEVSGGAAVHVVPAAADVSRTLRALLSSPETLARLGTAGRERAAELTWARTAEALAAAVAEVAR